MGNVLGHGNAGWVCGLAGAIVPLPTFASGIPTGNALEEIVVTAQRIGLIGESRAASEAVVLAIQLEGRPAA